MNSLGIYFGPKAISLAECKGKKVLRHLRLDLPAKAEEKVPAEVKIASLLKEELRKNKIEAEEVFACLCGKDIIIRTFDIPQLPAAEMASAINFEARKYLPFKIEELVTHFQLKPDKVNRKNLVLFYALKKETLDKYTSLFKQLNLKVATLEYAGFSILRLLKLKGVKTKGITAVINADFSAEEEVNFTVLENGFVLFNRDITLSSEGEPLTMETRQAQSLSMLSEKLKTEIRISLDYYQRKFPAKKIAKLLFICPLSGKADLAAFAKEVGLAAEFMEIENLSSAKSYCACLSGLIKTELKTEVWRERKEIKTPAEAVGLQVIKKALLLGLKIEPKIVALSIFLWAGILIFSISRSLPLKKEINSIIANQPKLTTINPNQAYERLAQINLEYKARIKALDSLIKEQLRLTEVLDALPRLLPEGVWLENISFEHQEVQTQETALPSFTLSGIAYLADSQKEFRAVNQLLSQLKENPVFKKYFKEINLLSLNQGVLGDTALTRFNISCSSGQRRK